jgi:hypothetical protein
MRSSSLRVCSAWFVGTSFKFGIFMLMLSIHVRNWCPCRAYASGTDVHAEHTHQFLTRMLRVLISSWCICSAFFEGNALCVHISIWCVCSVHAPVPDSYAQLMHQFLTRMLSARINSLCACWGYTKWTFEKYENWCTCWAYAQFLMRTLMVRISSWPICSACA